jgi:hypothetical protein
VKILNTIKCFRYLFWQSLSPYFNVFGYGWVLFAVKCVTLEVSNFTHKGQTRVKIFSTIKCCSNQYNAGTYSGNHFHPILMFSGMVECYSQSKASLWKSPILPTKVRLGWKYLPQSNVLATSIMLILFLAITVTLF